jgi:uncharacterized repeat protein (TIGR01451 family)
MLLVFLGVLTSVFLSGSAMGSVVVHRTVVSLTFDDGRESQVTAGNLLASHGMHGTFYLNSGDIGSGNTLTYSEVQTLAAAGNEIGGHTVNHVDLTTLSLQDAQDEICNDRTTLQAHGFTVSSFAYPSGNSNANVAALVAYCGYTSARITQGLGTAGWCATATCPAAETIPPLDPYDVRATGSVTDTVTLAQLESLVTNAEQNGGGWVPFIFHDIGPDVDGYSISTAHFTEFLDWLSQRQSRGTIVRTVGEVMSGAVNPPPPGPNLLQNPSFDNDTNADGIPDCWYWNSWGTNSGSWTETADAHTVPGTAVKGEITSWVSGERRFTVIHSSACAPPVTPGQTYRVTGWYKGTLSPYLMAYWDDGTNSFSLGSASSPNFPVSAGWHEFDWTTPPAPAGATALSIALTIGGSTGDITFDDFALGDAAGTPPDVQISAPGTGSYVSGTTTLSANASDDQGIQNLAFYVDDKPVGTDTSAPYSLGWNSTTASEGTHTLTVLATDLNGAQSYDSRSFLVDNTIPTGNLTAPIAGFLHGTVTLESDSSDTGSGVASVSFQRSPAGQDNWTEIGADTTSPYSASWDTRPPGLDGSYDLRAVTTDKAGNSFTSSSTSVTVDNAPPDVSLGTKPANPSNSPAASFAFSSTTDFSATFQCALDGAGFTSCSSPQEYTGLTEGSHNFSVKAIDGAGNESTVASYDWTIDTTAPDVSIGAKPGNPTNSTIASFEFSSSDGTATFQCSLDRGDYSACTSPKAYSSLTDGSHSFSVKAIDPAGNQGAVSYDWTINPVSDLSITKSDGVTSVNETSTLTYTIAASNAGPFAASGAVFKDAAVTNLTVSSVSCGSASGGAVCPAAPDTSKALMQSTGIVIPTLPSGGSVTFTVTGSVGAGARIENTATIDPPFGTTDPSGANNSATDTDTVNRAPVANAGLDQTVDASSTATLDGSQSSDPDHDALSYKWVQTAGATVTLSSVTAAKPTFTAPAGNASLTFKLTVNDGRLTSSDTVMITVVRKANPAGKVYKRPQTKLVKAKILSAKQMAIFRFSGSNGKGKLSFQCKLDKGKYKSCRSGKSYKHLKLGKHIFRVRAKDAGGKVDLSPATKRFKI